jgi:cytochrome P450
MPRLKYHFPPGLKANLIWYAFRKFRPADPIALFQYLASEFGDAVHYKIGPNQIVFLNDPALIREVLVVQNDNFTKERTVRRTQMLLGEGMICSEGEPHKAQRQAAQAAFHRQRIGGYAETIVAETVRMRDSWRDGEVLDISREMMHLTLRIIARTLFNTELGSEVRELADAINRIMRLYNYLVALPRNPPSRGDAKPTSHFAIRSSRFFWRVMKRWPTLSPGPGTCCHRIPPRNRNCPRKSRACSWAGCRTLTTCRNSNTRKPCLPNRCAYFRQRGQWAGRLAKIFASGNSICRRKPRF